MERRVRAMELEKRTIDNVTIVAHSNSTATFASPDIYPPITFLIDPAIELPRMISFLKHKKPSQALTALDRAAAAIASTYHVTTPSLLSNKKVHTPRSNQTIRRQTKIDGLDDIETEDLHSEVLAKRYLPLTELSEILLTRKAFFNHDQAALDQVINSNLRIAVLFARKYEGIGKIFNMAADDLIAEGYAKIVTVMPSFDPTKNFRVSTYLYRCLRNHFQFQMMQQMKGMDVGRGSSDSLTPEMLERAYVFSGMADEYLEEKHRASKHFSNGYQHKSLEDLVIYNLFLEEVGPVVKKVLNRVPKELRDLIVRAANSDLTHSGEFSQYAKKKGKSRQIVSHHVRRIYRELAEDPELQRLWGAYRGV